MSIFTSIGQKAKEVYTKVDTKLGGVLPGGYVKSSTAPTEQPKSDTPGRPMKVVYVKPRPTSKDLQEAARLAKEGKPYSSNIKDLETVDYKTENGIETATVTKYKMETAPSRTKEIIIPEQPEKKSAASLFIQAAVQEIKSPFFKANVLTSLGGIPGSIGERYLELKKQDISRYETEKSMRSYVIDVQFLQVKAERGDISETEYYSKVNDLGLQTTKQIQKDVLKGTVAIQTVQTGITATRIGLAGGFIIASGGTAIPAIAPALNIAAITAGVGYGGYQFATAYPDLKKSYELAPKETIGFSLLQISAGLAGGAAGSYAGSFAGYHLFKPKITIEEIRSLGSETQRILSTSDKSELLKIYGEKQTILKITSKPLIGKESEYYVKVQTPYSGTAAIKEIGTVEYPGGEVTTYKGAGKVSAKGFEAITVSETDLKIGDISYGKGTVTSLTKIDGKILSSIKDIGLITQGGKGIVISSPASITLVEKLPLIIKPIEKGFSFWPKGTKAQISLGLQTTPVITAIETGKISFAFGQNVPASYSGFSPSLALIPLLGIGKVTSILAPKLTTTQKSVIESRTAITITPQIAHQITPQRIRTAQMTAQITTLITVPVITPTIMPAIISPPITLTPAFAPPFMVFPPFYPNIRQLGFGEAMGMKSIIKKQSKAYQPSLRALIFNIKAPKIPRLSYTGIGIRPIITGIKRRKRK